MKRKIVVFCFAILLTILPCVVFVGCNDTKKDEPEEPWSKEDIEEMIRKKYFDEDGKAITYYWEKGIKDDGVNNYVLPEITGFEVHFIKDAQTKEEDWFLVEFEPIGCYIGCRRFSAHRNDSSLGGSWPYKRYSFSYIPSNLKLLGIPYEKAYCRANALFVQLDDVRYKDTNGEEKTGPLMLEIGVGKGLEYLRPGKTYRDFLRKNSTKWIDAEGIDMVTYNSEKYRVEELYIYRPLYGEYDPLEEHIEEIRRYINEEYNK